jgi:seryl-tRNA synthetase
MSEDLHLLCKSREDYRKKFDSHLTEQDQLAATKLKEEKKTIKERVEEIDPSEDPMLDENKETDKALENIFIAEMDKVGINEENIEAHSEGLGDTISKVLKKIGITEERFEKLPGMGGCGCSGRKTFLNKIFPYRNKEGK